MAKLGKVLAITAVAALAFGGMIGGKWYMTTTSETIDPQRGVYGMDGLEIWIDINARMPDFARVWACETLRAREAVVLGGKNSMAPHSCQPDFREQMAANAGKTMVDMILSTNIDSALQQMPSASDEAKQAMTACIKDGVAAAVPAEQQEAANNSDTDAMSALVLAANQTMRDCVAKAGN